MPSLCLVGRVVDCDDADDDLTTEETAGRRQSHPAKDVDPPRDPRKKRLPLMPGDDVYPCERSYQALFATLSASQEGSAYNGTVHLRLDMR